MLNKTGHCGVCVCRKQVSDDGGIAQLDGADSNPPPASQQQLDELTRELEARKKELDEREARLEAREREYFCALHKT